MQIMYPPQQRKRCTSASAHPETEDRQLTTSAAVAKSACKRCTATALPKRLPLLEDRTPSIDNCTCSSYRCNISKLVGPPSATRTSCIFIGTAGARRVSMSIEFVHTYTTMECIYPSQFTIYKKFFENPKGICTHQLV